MALRLKLSKKCLHGRLAGRRTVLHDALGGERAEAMHYRSAYTYIKVLADRSEHIVPTDALPIVMCTGTTRRRLVDMLRCGFLFRQSRHCLPLRRDGCRAWRSATRIFALLPCRRCTST